MTVIVDGSRRRWIGSSVAAVLDQGLFATSNFAVNILLARWLMPADFGRFTIAYASVLLLGTIHTSILSDPMLVFGAHRFRQRFGSYLWELLRVHWTASLALVLLAGLVMLVSEPRWPTVTVTALGIALLCPTIYYAWLMRRACYAVTMPHLAAIAGAIYAVVSLAIVVMLRYFGELTITGAFVALAVGSIAAGVTIHGWLRPRRLLGNRARLFQAAIARHWIFGRWTVGGGLLYWVSPNLYYYVLPAFTGIEGSGALRAALYLAVPAQHFFTALGPVLLSGFTRSYRRNELAPTFALALRWCLLFGALMSFVLIAFGRSLLHILYDGKYDAYLSIAFIVAAYPLVQAATTVIGNALLAREQPSKTFWAGVWSAGVTVAIGLPLAFWLGPTGAAIGFVVAAFTTLVAIAKAYRYPKHLTRS